MIRREADGRTPAGVLEALAARISPVRSILNTGQHATKGSIKEGKLADLVVLSDNPLTVDPATIKEGRTVWARE